MKWVLFWVMANGDPIVVEHGYFGYWESDKACYEWGWDWMHNRKKALPSWAIHCYTEEELLKLDSSVVIIQHR